ncbi:Mitochondrial fusion and transport protein ugo1 [Neolecta irregularis DAH-3]|uniref:Mitochondrial fusion and transport protein ugo1 n=1 Tax=Neolecta irregularis (strain DAH-3) TaxID=1198029 RepID=A0A1U7LUK1_NEOID|nr:Mitochondrial fusion and transport protein ugo1 [Neolecta irregularis DAH-3]|eukprot:OLL26355.1 Mitochondrial fusion and transport protein ugo1 [Neolecta irregularis DAH-3]
MSTYRPYAYLPEKDPFPLSLGIPDADIGSRSNVFSDVDYEKYFELPNAQELLSRFAQEATVRYFTGMIAQPWEVAKTILQCQLSSSATKSERPLEYQSDDEDIFSEKSSDGDEPSYFSSIPVPGYMNQQGGRNTDRTGYIIPSSGDKIARPSYQLQVSSTQVRKIVSALWKQEGARGLLKAQNTTFVYSVVYSVMESWCSSLLAAVFSLPDPILFGMDESLAPMMSLGCTVAASAITALVLAPLDIARTRLMLTPFDVGPRDIVPPRAVSTWICPKGLVVPTILHSTLPSMVGTSVSMFLRRQWVVEWPAFAAMSSFVTIAFEMLVRLPLETILRRGQLAAAEPKKTIVRVGVYYGVMGTAWHIVRNEGGMGGLYRGWKVVAWGAFAPWALSLVNVEVAGGEGESEF